jgi:hypothetical protein
MLPHLRVPVKSCEEWIRRPIRVCVTESSRVLVPTVGAAVYVTSREEPEEPKLPWESKATMTNCLSAAVRGCAPSNSPSRPSYPDACQHLRSVLCASMIPGSAMPQRESMQWHSYFQYQAVLHSYVLNKKRPRFSQLVVGKCGAWLQSSFASVDHGVRTKSRVLVKRGFANIACANMGSARSSNSSDQHAALDLVFERTILHWVAKPQEH